MVVASSLATFLGTMGRHGARTLRSGGLPSVFSVVLVAAGALALGTYATLVLNVERVGRSMGHTIAAVAFLDVQSAAEAEEVRATIALDPRVDEARLISPAEALTRARRALGDAGKALEGSTGVVMPWVVEVTPRVVTTQRNADGDALHPSVEPLLAWLRGARGVEEVMHPSADVARVEALLRFLHGGGLMLGGLLAAVVLLVVSNALRVAVFHRREEIAILKLVGASNGFVQLPFLLSGVVHGMAGAALGIAGLWALHAGLARVAEDAFSSALGAFVLEPLPAVLALALVGGGSLLGALGATFAVRRHLRA